MKSVTPQFFGISDMGNSLSDCGKSMKKNCVVKDFRANVLKKDGLAQLPRCTSEKDCNCSASVHFRTKQ